MSGLTVFAIAALVIRRSGRARLLYGLLLIATVIWSVFEAGLDLFALLPRLAAWLVVGLWFLAPWYRARLRCSRLAHGGWWIAGPSAAAAALLTIAGLQGYEHNGTGTQTRAPLPQLAYDWRHYGNTADGTRFAAVDQINRGRAYDE